MSQSLSSIYLHAVFSTKERKPFLGDQSLRTEVHAYIAGITRKLDCPAVIVGGYVDHVHALVRFGKAITVADWLREVKRISSGFVKQRKPEFAWQAGYGVFSIEAASVERVTAYIRNQEEHHRKVSFQDELRSIMREHGVEWDERYFWD